MSYLESKGIEFEQAEGQIWSFVVGQRQVVFVPKSEKVPCMSGEELLTKKTTKNILNSLKDPIIVEEALLSSLGQNECFAYFDSLLSSKASL
jgi:hypothetical protein